MTGALRFSILGGERQTVVHRVLANLRTARKRDFLPYHIPHLELADFFMLEVLRAPPKSSSHLVRPVLGRVCLQSAVGIVQDLCRIRAGFVQRRCRDLSK